MVWKLSKACWCFGGAALAWCLSAATAFALPDGGPAIAPQPHERHEPRYASLPSAERLAADIAAFGAPEVLHERLWPDQRVFDDLLHKIETGNADWLRIAAALRTASDAGASEGLSAALSIALVKRAGNVLRVLAPGDGSSPFTVTEVCSARFAFIEQPVAEKRWRSQVQRAVASERDERLASVRDACLAALPPDQ